MNHASIAELVRADFTSLFLFKSRGETLEITTPYTMANRDAVAVCVKEQGPDFVCAIEIVFEHLRPRQRRRLQEQMRYYEISRKGNWFYKKAHFVETISSVIFDLACFTSFVSMEFPIKPEYMT